MVHGRPSLMLGAGSRLTPLHHQCEGRPPVRLLRRRPVTPSTGLRCFVEVCKTGLPAVAAKQRRLVPVEGIEPPLLAEHDFESCASTSSATRASAAIYIRRPARSAKRKSAGRALLSSVCQKAQKAALIAWTAFLFVN